jgi:hypothetical protein
MSEGLTPVAYMLAVLRDKDAEQGRRAWAAEKLAPYVHPRPAPEARRVNIDLPDTSTTKGLTEAMAAIVKATARGLMSPSEAQSFVSILEAQRKAIETDDLLTRMEKLEGVVGPRAGLHRAA